MDASLLVIGAGGHGCVVADVALECGYANVAFLDDNKKGRVFGPCQIVGRVSELESYIETWPTAIAAIGTNQIRREIFYRLQSAGFSIPSVIHPSAAVSRYAAIADGAFVAACAAVNIGADIGEAVIINTGATIDHDCIVKAGAHISPGAHLAGNVYVGESAWIGIGASVRDGTNIGAGAVVGAGAAVVKDVPDGAIVVGVPAAKHGPSR